METFHRIAHQAVFAEKEDRTIALFWSQPMALTGILWFVAETDQGDFIYA